jgi:hypothetical protein
MGVSNMKTSKIAMMIGIILLLSVVTLTSLQINPLWLNPLSNNGGTLYSIANTDTVYTLNCTLPPVSASIGQIKAQNIPITVDETKLLVKSLFGYEPAKVGPTQSEQIIILPKGVLSLIGYTTMIYDANTVDVNKVNDFASIKAVADEFKGKVLASVPFRGYDLVYDNITLGMSTIENGTTLVNYWTVGYRAKVNGIAVYGAGLWVGVCNGDVVSVVSSLPNIEVTSSSIVVVSPDEALKRLGRGEFNGSIADGGIAYVNKMALGYWYVPNDAEVSTIYQPKVVYSVTGILLRSTYKDSFSVYVPAN